MGSSERSQSRAGGESYIPAFRYRWLTTLYDPLMRWIVRESKFKPQLVKQAGIETDYRVLDLGCGTGTLTILTKRMHPGAEVVGVDVDSAVLGIARAKATRAATEVRFDEGSALHLLYPGESFDRVLSSLFFHHLRREEKVQAAQESIRVLRPGGELHLVDFGKPRTALARVASTIVGRMEHARDNVAGLMPELLHAAGFHDIDTTAEFTTVFGTFAMIRARRR